ncbi:DUF3644 domain-containing protein [Bradyrhizobium sp. UFLA05-109]
MRKEAKALHGKAVDSLVMAVDHFNRCWDRGRTETVLIMLDHAFELLLKTIIVHRNGSIREKNKEGMTIGFDLCLRKCVSDNLLKCLTEDQAVTLQSLNTLRDAAQHYMIELSEEHLYVYAQSAVSLFAKLVKDVLKRPLDGDVPSRILPVCANPPSDLATLFDAEFADIKRMVSPGSRRRLDARNKLRSLAVLQSSLDGKKSQASDGELDKIVRKINAGEDWRQIFPGVATLKIEPQAQGKGLSLKITRNQGEAVHLVDEGNPDATVMAVRKVNELDFYSLGLRDIAKKLKRSEAKLLWLIVQDRMQDNPEYFKEIKIGRSLHKRYSGKCLASLSARLSKIDLDALYASRTVSSTKNSGSAATAE